MSHKISRRRLLSAGMVLGAVGTVGAVTRAMATATDGAQSSPGDQLTFPSPDLTPYVDDLWIPPSLSGDRTLSMARSSHRFHRDLDAAPTWSFGGQPYLGPTIEARSGEKLKLTFTNNLNGHLFAKDIDTSLDGASEEDRTRPRTSVHLHGAVVRPEFDGHTENTFRTGASMTYEFTNGQEATALWYHDHAMGITRLNVPAGLAGKYLIRDEFDTGTSGNPLGLPSGDYEIPLIVADHRFNADGSLNPRTARSTPEGTLQGPMIGDMMSVNGVVMPTLEVARGLYRFRLLNASNWRAYHLYLSNNMPFRVIGNDGGLLNSSVSTTSIRVSPGERADLLIDFSALSGGDTVELRNDAEVNPSIAATSGAYTLPRVMRFTVSSSRGFTKAAPTGLRGGPSQPATLPPATAVSNRRVVGLTMTAEGMALSNLCYGDDPIEKPKQGSTEVWEIVNSTVEDHPVHLHLVNMRVLSRQSIDTPAYVKGNPAPPMGNRWAPPADRYLKGDRQPPEAWEAGLKDTVLCPVNTVTRVLIRFPTADELGFDPDAVFTSRSGDRLQGYVWHCHLIDHEDDCMMAQYRIVS
ncbi:multicopper oxidase family protein [Streptomyces sp. NPDC058371]|uniref:multicopper oxidase family protein n=1 Tax=Streptomyces sp. NPDC058371 TaxID=3346463 RepID=UPI003651009C